MLGWMEILGLYALHCLHLNSFTYAWPASSSGPLRARRTGARSGVVSSGTSLRVLEAKAGDYLALPLPSS